MKAYKYKIFDRNKFTVTGSPTITSDGIASGLNGENYIQIDNPEGNVITYKGYVDFSQRSNDTAYGILAFRETGISTLVFRISTFNTFALTDQGAGTINSNINIQTLNIKKAFYEITFDLLGRSCNLKVVDADTLQEYNSTIGLTDQAYNTISNADYIYIGLAPGVPSWSAWFEKTITDLKQFLIYIDNKQVFSGTKELYKLYTYPVFDSSKFTVVGSPSITSDGIASGFSNRNYINFTDTLKSNITTINKAYFITGKITTPVTITSSQDCLFCIQDVDINNWTRICITPSKVMTFYNKVNGTNTIASLPFSLNTTYDFICGQNEDGTVFLKIKELGSDIWESAQSATSPMLNVSVQIARIGQATHNDIEAFEGSIDLKQFSITVDGVEVFNCTKPAYKAFNI